MMERWRCLSKDSMLYDYGVLKCGAEDFAKIDGADIVGYRKSGFGYGGAHHR